MLVLRKSLNSCDNTTLLPTVGITTIDDFRVSSLGIGSLGLASVKC